MLSVINSRYLSSCVYSAGIPQNEAEVALEPWLQSPLLSGGVEASEDVMGASDWRSLDRRSWEQAWNGEQEGRLLRTRSFMAWDSGVREADALETRRHRYPTPTAERAGSGDHKQPFSEFRLTVRVNRAARIPRGLVLWPDDPVVRLTAVVDGRDHSVHEEILMISMSTDGSCTPPAMGDPSVAIDESCVAQHNSCPAEVTYLDEVRHGQQEHVFALHIMPRTSTLGGDKQNIPISIRADVFIGGVITCSGTLSVSHLQRTSTVESNSNLQALQLNGGAEMTLAVNLTLVTVGYDSTEDVPVCLIGADETLKKCASKSENQSSRVRSDSVESSGELDGVHMQRFLDSITCWGTGMHVSVLSEKAGCRNPTVSTVSDESQSCSGDGRREKSNTDEVSLFADLVEWLGRSHPDPPFLRVALEKTGNYAFPLVEAPFIAALLKHGGLVGEAYHAAKMMSARSKGKCRTLVVDDLLSLRAQVLVFCRCTLLNSCCSVGFTVPVKILTVFGWPPCVRTNDRNRRRNSRAVSHERHGQAVGASPPTTGAFAYPKAAIQGPFFNYEYLLFCGIYSLTCHGGKPTANSTSVSCGFLLQQKSIQSMSHRCSLHLLKLMGMEDNGAMLLG